MQSVARSYDKMGEVFTKLGDLKTALDNYRRSVGLLEQALARDTGNDLLRRVTATIDFDIGELCSRLAAPRKAADNERSELWIEARKAYQRSLELFLDLRSRRVFTQRVY